eukprot:255847_1
MSEKAKQYLQTEYFSSMCCSFDPCGERLQGVRDHINQMQTGEPNTKYNEDSKLLFGIDEGTPISQRHIIAMIAYCNTDVLQRRLTETYRRIPENETDASIIKRHQNYANWGQLLVECVVLFGKVSRQYWTFPPKFESKHVLPIPVGRQGISMYHGISKITQFKSVQPTFAGPLST